MDTQVINENAKNKNVKETLKKGTALVGAAGVGAGAVVSVDVVRGDEELDVVEPISPLEVADVVTEPTTEPESPKTEESTATATTGVHATNETASHHVAQPTEPQPQSTTNAHHAADAGTNANVVPSANHGEINTDDIPNVDPNLVAQDITDNVIMIDPTDNDMGNLDIAAVGTIETVDGQVLSAAQFTGDNGETLYAVDVDGDNIYDVVQDESGNLLAEIPSTLTVGDSESIVSENNGDNGYLAQNEHDNVSDDSLDNPMDDVVDLG